MSGLEDDCFKTAQGNFLSANSGQTSAIALTSIGISLKRIADAIEKQNEPIPMLAEDAIAARAADPLERIANAICYQPAGENIFDFLQQIARAADENNNRR